MKKTILLTIALCVTFAIASGVIAYLFLFSMYYDEMEDSLQRHVSLIANENKETQLLYVKKMIAQRFITAAYDEDEERFIGPPVYDVVSLRSDLTEEQPLRSNRTIFLRSTYLPRIVLIYSLDDYIRPEIYLRFLIPFYVLIIIISIGVYYVSYLFFIRPITVITNTTQRITRGEYDVHVNEEGIAEIRTLARHFNDMSSTVKNTMQLLNYVIDNLGVGFVVLQQDGMIVHANKMAQIFYGGKLDTCNAVEIFPFLSSLLHKKRFNDGVFFTQTFTAMDGTPVYADFVLTRMSSGTEGSIVMIVQKRQSVDTTECGIQATTLKTLSSVIAHEIKNPLNVIAMIITTLKKKYPEDHKWYDIEQQMQSINAITSQIDSLIDFSPEQINTKDFLEYYFTQWYSVLDVGSLEFVVETDSAPLIFFDSFKLKIICDNIIKNALEECKDNLHLTVRLRDYEKYIFIEFSDNGKGFDAESLVRLTQLGYTTKEQGSGIGMYIIRLLLAMGSATMELTSGNEKETTISMRFDRYENTAD